MAVSTTNASTTDASTTDASTHGEANNLFMPPEIAIAPTPLAQLLPQVSSSTATVQLTKPSANPTPSSSATPAAIAPPVASKADFVSAQSSQQAADLRFPTHQVTGLQEDIDLQEAIDSEEPVTQWQVSSSPIPSLNAVTKPPSGFKPEQARSPQLSFNQSAPLIVAADPGNPELPPVFDCPNPDPELGCIRLQNPFSPTKPPPILYLIPRIDFFQSNNLLLGIDPINDGLIRPTISLLTVPPLGRNTYILASVDGSFSRYFRVPQFNYDELRIRAGLLQRLSPSMTAELGWTNQQLFISGDKIRGLPAGTRFLNDQAIRLELSRRDQLKRRLFLNSIYQFRVGFSDPADRSRILNVLFLSLNYDLNPAQTVQIGVDYQFLAANYTVVERTDIYQQLLGRVTLSAFRNSQLSLYSGVSFGSSTERGIDFNSLVLGVSLSVNVVLF